MKRFFCASLAFFLLFALTCPCFAAPSVSAESAVLLDAKDGEILFEKNAGTKLAMASTTKIMTALVVLERADMKQVVTIPKEAVGVEGSSAYLYQGEKITVRDLLFALLLQSANDAAEALALHVSKTLDDFVSLMNETAQKFGLTDTTFQNPHGLPAEGHHSTALDLARLMQAALENPEFVAISGAKNHTTTPPKGGTAHYFRNHNRLLSDYDDCIAGKTGYTRSAGRCLVTAAERDGATLICVTLSAPNDWYDHKNLYDFGFSHYESQLLYQKGALSCRLPVVGSVDKFVVVANTEDVYASVRTKDGIRTEFDLPHFIYAPVVGLDRLDEVAPSPPDGMCAGAVLLKQGTRTLAKVKLYYTTSVDEYIPPTLWERILQFFGWKKSESKNS